MISALLMRDTYPANPQPLSAFTMKELFAHGDAERKALAVYNATLTSPLAFDDDGAPRKDRAIIGRSILDHEQEISSLAQNKPAELSEEKAGYLLWTLRAEETARYFVQHAQPSEMPLFFQSLAVEENETARDYIYLSLMTGARKANVLAMRWDEINWELEIWRIPETKNGESLIIPLIPEAFEVLKRRKEKVRSEWVFENEEGTSHLADPKKAWDRVRERATIELWKQTPRLAELIEEVEEGLRTANNYGYTIVKLYKTVCEVAKKRDMKLPVGLMDLRLHDIRRTLGSYQAITGASLQVIGKSLGHKSQAATQVYSHLNLDPVRASVEKATAAMFAAGK